MTKGSNQPKVTLFLFFICIKNHIWGMEMDHNLFWGYAGLLNSYLGVRGRVLFMSGGTQVSKGSEPLI